MQRKYSAIAIESVIEIESFILILKQQKNDINLEPLRERLRRLTLGSHDKGSRSKRTRREYEDCYSLKGSIRLLLHCSNLKYYLRYFMSSDYSTCTSIFTI